MVWPSGAIVDTCDVCGSRPLAPSDVEQPQLEGSVDVLPGSWPWIVSLQLPTITGHNHTCGGSLITARNLPHWRAVVGATKLSSLGPEVHVRYVKQVVIHEDYKPTTEVNDIALMELDQPVKCSDYIQPACVPDSTVRVPTLTYCYIGGWGVLRQGGATKTLDVMQEAKVDRFPAEECNSTSWYNGDIREHNLCAGYEKAGIDSCKGDSGGPLMCTEEASLPFWVIGVTSWSRGCGKARRPGVYTATQPFYSWVKGWAGPMPQFPPAPQTTTSAATEPVPSLTRSEPETGEEPAPTVSPVPETKPTPVPETEPEAPTSPETQAPSPPEAPSSPPPPSSPETETEAPPTEALPSHHPHGLPPLPPETTPQMETEAPPQPETEAPPQTEPHPEPEATTAVPESQGSSPSPPEPSRPPETEASSQTQPKTPPPPESEVPPQTSSQATTAQEPGTPPRPQPETPLQSQPQPESSPRPAPTAPVSTPEPSPPPETAAPASPAPPKAETPPEPSATQPEAAGPQAPNQSEPRREANGTVATFFKLLQNFLRHTRKGKGDVWPKLTEVELIEEVNVAPLEESSQPSATEQPAETPTLTSPCKQTETPSVTTVRKCLTDANTQRGDSQGQLE
ncbi:uncharacterized protein LOC110070565 [Pogona vitticeps]